MSLEDMPPPGSSEWLQWFSKQDPATQWQVQYSFGNELPTSMTAGGMAPELSPFGFDIAGAGGQPLPEISTKGKVLPVDVDTRKKQLGVMDAQNSALMDPVTMLMAGAGSFDPQQFQSTLTGIGAPIQRPGHQLVEGYSQGGGYQEFIADQLLAGKTPSAAMGELMKVITGGETGDPKIDGARDALIATLDPRYDNNAIPGVKPAAPDLTTPASVASAYDIKGISDWAKGMYEKILTDPTQGMLGSDNQYYGAVKEEKTPAQQYFDKNALPYPTASYLDPDRLQPFLDAVAPVDQEAVAGWDTERSAAEQALNEARTKNTDTETSFKALEKAWNEALAKGQTGGKYVPATREVTEQIPIMGPGLPGSMATVQNIKRREEIPGAPQVWEPANVSSADLAPWIDVDPITGGINLAKDQFQTVDWGPSRDAGAGLTGKAQVNRPTHRRATKEDIDKVSQQRAMVQKTLADAVGRSSRANVSPQGLGARAYQLAKMQNVAAAGRTPLQDALAQRVLAARRQGVY